MALRRRPVRLLAPLALALLLTLPSAVAAETRDIAGWWIAIDRLFPQLYETGGIVPMEELLVIGRDGHAENRFVMFVPPDPQWCRDKKEQCSDAPVIARAQATLKRDQLTFTNPTPADYPIESRPEIDYALRQLAATGTRSWTVSREADGRALVLRPNLLNPSRLVAKIPTRVFARIEPDRLQRIRALLLARELSAARHWRCLLANATAQDLAFAKLEQQVRTAPPFLDNAMKVASYLMALGDAWRLSVNHDADPEQRKLAAVTVEALLTEKFEDIRPPSSTAERAALADRYMTLRRRLAGDTGVTLSGISLTDAELADFATAMGHGAEAKKLFCGS